MMAKQKPDGAEQYNASSLQVLEGLDAVRKRPGMYIGSTDSRGLQHCLWEIVDNSVDEAIGGHCTHIKITLHEDGSVEVRDNGRGIPTDIEKKTGLSGVEVVFTKLHAGGKFGGGGYAVSGGLHGVGASVVNALSSRLDVDVHRAGELYTLSFDHGVAGQFDKNDKFTPGTLTSKEEKTGETGTRVRYWADPSIFLKEASLDLELTYQRARQTAFLVPGLRLTVTDNRYGKKTVETFHFEGGMADMIRYQSTGTSVNDVIHIKGSATFNETVPVLRDGALVPEEIERNLEVECALRWTGGYETDIRSFVNIISTPKGGTHLTGFQRAMNRTLNDTLKATKTVRPAEESATGEDINEGLVAVVLVRLAEPQFEGQTKEVLGTAAATQIVNQVVSDGLRNWLANPKNKAQSKAVLEKVAGAMRARVAARLQRETVRRKTALESSNSLPAKLSDCRTNDRDRSELILIEGDSAGGTVKAARDSEFQALMPLRGKILNVMKASEKQMLDNAECASIIAAMGGGSGKSFDLNNIRYGKLIFMTDADVDGSHIRCLLLTLCYRYLHPLLAAGRVYAAMPPLYRIEVSNSKEHIYCYSDVERDEQVAALETAGKKIKGIQRYKGLGEMDADQLAETTIDVDKRKLRRMTVDDASAADRAFEMLMGNEVSSRKEFIVRNGGLLDRSRIDA
jgi:DNA gyrase subunit B